MLGHVGSKRPRCERLLPYRCHICCRAAPPAAPTATQLTSLLEQLDSNLSMFVRLRDASGIQETCRLIWAASLPLMQPGLRSHIKRPCASAAQALELIESQLHRLRQGRWRVQWAVQLDLQLAGTLGCTGPFCNSCCADWRPRCTCFVPGPVSSSPGADS